MEYTTATVSAVHGHRASVVVKSRPNCPRCAAGRGCGAATLQPPSCIRLDIDVPTGVRVRPGDEVALSVATGRLLRAAWLVYGLPLASVLVALATWAAIGSPDGDLETGFVASAGLAGGVLAARGLAARFAADCRYRPRFDSKVTGAGG